MSRMGVQQKKVLISAYACAPDRGAEPGVGWNLVAHLAGLYGYQLTVITRPKNQRLIEASDDPRVEGVNWIYIDPPDWFVSRKRGAIGMKIFYLWWQRRMRAAAAEYLRENKVDLVHHLTFGNILPATPLADFGLPLVVGPVGGAEMTPPDLIADLRPRLWMRDRLRCIIYKLGSWLPSTSKTYRKCSVALGATDASVQSLKDLGTPVVKLVPQSGCGNDEVAAFAENHPVSETPPSGPIRLLSACRLVHWKGVDLTIDAVARAVKTGCDVELTILQDGVEREHLRALVKNHGLDDRVHFLGKLPSLKDVYRMVRKSDALMHPAVNEAFGQSVLEALALGRQVICLDWAGPGMIVTENCGIKIPAGNRESIVQGMCNAITSLTDRRGQWVEIQNAAIARAKDFSWQKVAAELNDAYCESFTGSSL